MSPDTALELVGPSTDKRALIQVCLPWLLEASNPYWSWLVGSAEQAQELLRQWMWRQSSEVSVERAVILRLRGVPIGGLIAMGGAEVRAARQSDVFCLLEWFETRDPSDLMTRLQQGGELFSLPEENTFYLSRMGILKAFRRKGLSHNMVRHYLANGAVQGFRRFGLDVFVHNFAAISLYEKHGFRRTSIRLLPGRSMGYQYMELVRSAEI